MKILCTFPGKNGDILWSLATVKQISKNYNVKVDFSTMPQYHTLLPLLNSQSYIEKATVNEAWLCTGSPHGDQPWNPQNAEELAWGYDQVFHLGYRYHPGIHGVNGRQMALIDFPAYLNNIEFSHPVLPFIDVEENWKPKTSLPMIAYSFNMEYKPEKDKFLHDLERKCVTTLFVDVASMPWAVAASVIKNSDGFVGCCSANHVLAYGVGQKNIFIYEPHPHRHAFGQFGETFRCPYGKVETHPLGSSPEIASELAAERINIWKSEENHYETAKA